MWLGGGYLEDLVESRIGYEAFGLHNALKIILVSLYFMLEALGNIFRSLNKGQDCNLIAK